MNILQLVNQDGYNLEILHAGSPNNSFLISGSVIRGDWKKPNRERLHLETSGLLHDKDHFTVLLTLSMDFFCHLFLYTKITKYCDT